MFPNCVARASNVGTADGSAWSVSAGMIEAIAEGKACRVSIGRAVPKACAVCARFWTSLIGWVTKLQARTNRTTTNTIRIFDKRDISISFSAHNDNPLQACLEKEA